MFITYLFLPPLFDRKAHHRPGPLAHDKIIQPADFLVLLLTPPPASLPLSFHRSRPWITTLNALPPCEGCTPPFVYFLRSPVPRRTSRMRPYSNHLRLCNSLPPFTIWGLRSRERHIRLLNLRSMTFLENRRLRGTRFQVQPWYFIYTIQGVLSDLNILGERHIMAWISLPWGSLFRT